MNKNTIEKLKLDFDDILIVPEIITNIYSRYDDVILNDNLPIINAPMDTVIDLSNIDYFINTGIKITLPRTINLIDAIKFQASDDKYKDVFISIGLKDMNKILSDKLIINMIRHKSNILLDIANGHMDNISKLCIELKKVRPDIILMIGNIANPETYKYYAKYQCIDYIRIGIGNGGGCLTTKQSGVGYPMASLIYEISKIKKTLINSGYDSNSLPKIVADGGMKDYSDIIKALALGADYVMIGSIINKSIESCGQNYYLGFKINNKLAYYLFNKGFKIKKYFRGMSTKEAQSAMGKSKSNHKTSEGVVRFRNVEYSFDSWLNNFKHYLRNAMSYTNCKYLNEFIGNHENMIHISIKSYERFNK